MHGTRRRLVKCGLLKDNDAEELAKAAHFVTAAEPLIVSYDLDMNDGICADLVRVQRCYI